MNIICLLNLEANILPILPHVEHNVTLFFCQLATTHLYILQEEAHHTALALLETVPPAVQYRRLSALRRQMHCIDP